MLYWPLPLPLINPLTDWNPWTHSSQTLSTLSLSSNSSTRPPTYTPTPSLHSISLSPSLHHPPPPPPTLTPTPPSSPCYCLLLLLRCSPSANQSPTPLPSAICPGLPPLPTVGQYAPSLILYSLIIPPPLPWFSVASLTSTIWPHPHGAGGLGATDIWADVRGGVVCSGCKRRPAIRSTAHKLLIHMFRQ